MRSPETEIIELQAETSLADVQGKLHVEFSS
jgi:hypothetical protein